MDTEQCGLTECLQEVTLVAIQAWMGREQHCLGSVGQGLQMFKSGLAREGREPLWFYWVLVFSY